MLVEVRTEGERGSAEGGRKAEKKGKDGRGIGVGLGGLVEVRVKEEGGWDKKGKGREGARKGLRAGVEGHPET
jgi:hypothetical protein